MAKTKERAPLKHEVHKVPVERGQFKELLAKNPNYFGNLTPSEFKPVKVIAGNSTYEVLHCVGLNPALGLLEATVDLKLPYGYGGDVCSPGSIEYIRFYVDYGAGWQDAGLGSFPAHDIPNHNDCAGQAEKPLSYVVSSAFDATETFCTNPELPNVRAILSWNLVPPAGAPNWVPIWGNVLDQHVQVRPKVLELGAILELISAPALDKLPPGLTEISTQPIPIPPPPEPSTRELAGMYAAAATGGPGAMTGNGGFRKVQAHRFGFKDLQATLGNGGTQLEIEAKMAEWKQLGLDWASALAALEGKQGNVGYEEIECLGLDVHADLLAASFRVKLPYGYDGPLCGLGSQEYVAFWADWNDTCTWSYLGTTSVQVHDFATLPADGLEYSAILSANLAEALVPCEEGPKVGRVRAVLSWATPPSTVDPDAVPYWGNIFDAHVQLPPKPVTTGLIDVIGGVSTFYIDTTGNGMTTWNAVFALGGSTADAWGRNRACPFGGLIILNGPPTVGEKYRIVTRPAGSASPPIPMTDPFYITPWIGPGSWITPDPSGWADYLPFSSNMFEVLGHWNPAGDDLWEIRLEVQGGSIGDWLRVQLDNTGPRRKPVAQPYEPPEVTCDVQITSGGGDCSDFGVGDPLAGTFVARDEHFGAFYIYTTPSTLSPPGPTTPTLPDIYTETAMFAAGGSPWNLDTTGMKPCGYVIRLEVYDRTIVGSHPGSHNANYSDVGFCLGSVFA